MVVLRTWNGARVRVRVGSRRRGRGNAPAHLASVDHEGVVAMGRGLTVIRTLSIIVGLVRLGWAPAVIQAAPPKNLRINWKMPETLDPQQSDYGQGQRSGITF